jgi:hypothetical protein
MPELTLTLRVKGSEIHTHDCTEFPAPCGWIDVDVNKEVVHAPFEPQR